jgi:hypothetical protein
MKVNTPKGIGLLEKLYITELGYIMAKIYYIDTKSWTNYRITDLPSMDEIKFLF